MMFGPMPPVPALPGTFYRIVHSLVAPAADRPNRHERRRHAALTTRVRTRRGANLCRRRHEKAV